MAGLERVRQYSLRPRSELYRLTCSAHDSAFAEFEPVFACVVATFETKA
jgi:hypothetical protein